MGETTGSAWIGACRDAVGFCEVAFRDAVLGGIVDVTTDPLCGVEACRNAGVGCEVSCCDVVVVSGGACRDADLGGTADVTAGP